MSGCGFDYNFNTKTDNRKTLTIKEEIKQYNSLVGKCSSKFDVFWSKFANDLPKLSKLVRKYNTILATSVPSESAFSVANYIQRKHRASLSASSLRFCMVLKSCSSLLNQE
jgi:hypothetical protein